MNTPDPAAWRLPDASLEILEGGNRSTVLRGGDHVFKKTTRSEAQLVWLDHARHPAREAGLNAVLPLHGADGRFNQSGWIAERFRPGRRITDGERARFVDAMQRFHETTRSTPQRPGFKMACDFRTELRGGDVDLAKMHADVVARCRAAWEALPPVATALIHADICDGNLAVGPDGALIVYDWDEARVDQPCFDLATLGACDDPVVMRAALAYEVACCWQLEPERSVRLAAKL